MVRAKGFEPSTSWSRTRCSSHALRRFDQVRRPLWRKNYSVSRRRNRAQLSPKLSLRKMYTLPAHRTRAHYGDKLAFSARTERRRRIIMTDWRRGWDSNPRDPFRSNGFQDRRLQPLGHPSFSNCNLQQGLAVGFVNCSASLREASPATPRRSALFP
jgi:hypothetical protein